MVDYQNTSLLGYFGIFAANENAEYMIRTTISNGSLSFGLKKILNCSGTVEFFVEKTLIYEDAHSQILL